MKFREGCKVPFPEKVLVGYSYEAPWFTANVDADKILAVLEHFISIHHEPLFFILELPSRKEEETELRPGVVEKLHKDVYYLGGRTQEDALALLHRFGDMLIRDGMSAFGFGCHQSHEEIMVGQYNVVSIYTGDEKAYEGFFERHGIHRVQPLVTAWNTFTKDAPGECERIDTDGKNVFDIPDICAEWGMFLAERREE